MGIGDRMVEVNENNCGPARLLRILSFPAVVFRRLFRAELLAPLFVAGLAWNLASAYLEKHIIEGRFYQEKFSPAVSLACGGGWNALRPEAAEGLRDFLLSKTSRLECGAIDFHHRAPIDQFQAVHRHLIGAVGVWWKAHGRADWGDLRGLFTLFFVLSALGAYAVLRLGAPAVLAGLGASLFAASEVHLTYLPHFRDYSKAPFILAAIAAISVLTTRWGARKEILVAASCVAGLATGLGIGFRTDLLLLVPFALGSIWLFGGENPAADLRKKLLVSAAFVAAFVASATSVLPALGRGANTAHVVLLGLMTPFDRAIGVRGTYYEIGNDYNDIYALSLINASHQAITGEQGVLTLATPEYDKAGLTYLRTLLNAVPADYATRALGSIGSVLSHEYKFPLLREAAWGPWGVLVAYLLLVAYWLGRQGGTRTGIYAVFVVLFFSGMASLQFHERHFFHLAIFQAAALTWSVCILARMARIIPKDTRRAIDPQASNGSRTRLGLPLVRNMGYLAIATLILYASLIGLRYVQSVKLVAYLDRLADVSAYAPVSSAVDGDQVAYAMESPSLVARAEKYFDHDVLLVELSASTCDASNIELVARYEASSDFENFTRAYNIHVDSNTRFVLPVFRSNRFRFVRFEVPLEHAGCVSFVGRLKDKRAQFLPTALLGENWKQWPAYQTLELEPRLDDDVQGTDHVPSSARLLTQRPPSHLLRNMPVLRGTHLAFASPEVALSDDGAYIGPQGRGKFDYLLTKPLARAAPGCRLAIAAEGKIHRGGLTVGVLDENQASWDAATNVQQWGTFRVVVVANHATGIPIIANYAPDGKITSATITKFGSTEVCPRPR